MVERFIHWLWRCLYDPTVFWVMVSGLATVILLLVAWKQLSALVRSSRADFVFRLKSEFFSEETRRLIHLIENDLIGFVKKSDDTYYFVIKDFASDEVQEKLKHMGFKGEIITSQEIDDLILGILEDVGMFQRNGRLELEDVYCIFSTYVKMCSENDAIREYLKFSRKGRGNKDVWVEFRLLADRLKKIEPKMIKQNIRLLDERKHKV
jgi:hypothetical protein